MVVASRLRLTRSMSSWINMDSVRLRNIPCFLGRPLRGKQKVQMVLSESSQDVRYVLALSKLWHSSMRLFLETRDRLLQAPVG